MDKHRIKLFLNTIKYLKVKQVVYRVFYFIRNRFFKKKYSKQLTSFSNSIVWDNYFSNNNSYFEDNSFKFLNISHDFGEKIDWNYNNYGKLWTYNLNYFDFLNQKNILKVEGLKLIYNYIDNYDDLIDGLEPYPTSLRCINWIKFLSNNDVSEKKIDQALYNQYYNLLHNIEYHLLANHLLENVFSLFFGAYYFKSEKFYKKSKELLIKQLEEQILNDGGHFELSPMYHKIILNRLLDCIKLILDNGWKNDYKFLGFLKGKASKMVSWLDEVTFKDGTVPMVNDSSFGIAPKSNILINYSINLGIEPKKNKLLDSGYRKITNNWAEVFLDVGNVGPSYQPGHAHADTFSFILHCNNEPIIVDPGVSTYEINETRENERSTSYHNTVSVNNLNSSQVWSGFRVAKRAKVKLYRDLKSKIFASHDGYRNIRIKHTRKFYFENNILTIKDEINKFVKAQAFFHFHPSCEIKINHSLNEIKVGCIVIGFDKEVILTKSNYNFALGFNKTIEAEKIKVEFDRNLVTTIKKLI